MVIPATGDSLQKTLGGINNNASKQDNAQSTDSYNRNSPNSHCGICKHIKFIAHSISNPLGPGQASVSPLPI
jgi:hypothetical protein